MSSEHGGGGESEWVRPVSSLRDASEGVGDVFEDAILMVFIPFFFALGSGSHRKASGGHGGHH